MLRKSKASAVIVEDFLFEAGLRIQNYSINIGFAVDPSNNEWKGNTEDGDENTKTSNDSQLKLKWIRRCDLLGSLVGVNTGF